MEPLRVGDPKRIGPYRLTARLGAGGMGQVFLAKGEGGEVAVKLMKPELASDTEFRRRFAREVAAARKVGERHAARVLDADAEAEPPWLATEFIPGPTLHEVVRENGPLSIAKVEALARGLAVGLTAIHECRLIHRDLKPGNVIMSPQGPRIIDFGIARAVDASTLTVTGAVVGTYAFMSPEQIIADRAEPASDIFALGCVLAFAATGTGPFDATTVPAIIHRILNEPPRLDGVTGMLRDTVDACLAKKPGDRPAAADIPRRLTSVAATKVDVPRTVPATKIDASRTAAAQRSPMGQATPPTHVLTGPGEDGPPIPPPEQARPSGLLRRRGFLLGGIVALGAVAVPTAVALWPESKPSKDSPTKSSDAKGTSILKFDAGVVCLAFSPDGKTLAVCVGDLQEQNESPAQGVRLWDVANGKQTTVITPNNTLGVKFSADGKTLATASAYEKTRDTRSGKGIQLWEVSSGDKITTVADGFDVDGYDEGMAFSPDGKIVARYVGNNGHIRLWDVESGEKITTLSDVSGSVMLFNSDGGKLVTIGREDVQLWDMATYDKRDLVRAQISPGVAYTPEGAISADGKTIFTIESKGTGVQLWDADTGDNVNTISTGDVTSMAVDGEGKTVVTAGDDGVLLWDAATGDKVMTVTEDRVFQVRCSPDAKTIVGTVGSGEIIMWTVD